MSYVSRSPEYIAAFLAKNAHRFDSSVQYLGDEPNSARKSFEDASVTALICAAWAYEAAAGNQSIPAVYKSINIAAGTRGDRPFMCDRWYLPSTPRDLATFERAAIPAFGIESKRQLADFDLVMTSISYPVLIFNMVKYLGMSGVPVRREERTAQRGSLPFVMIGGQSYGAPEVLAPIADAIWCGEVEDEEGNGGIGEFLRRIEGAKASGDWRADRTGVVRELAREFNHLYVPEFVKVTYRYEDRSHVGVGVAQDAVTQEITGLGPGGTVRPSKQVASITSTLPGMRLPIVKRFVKDFDKAVPLSDPPLLYADPGMGAGDVEVARGEMSEREYVLIEGQGLRRLGSWEEDDLHPHNADLQELRCDVAGTLYPVSHVLSQGVREMVEVRTVNGHSLWCTPDHELNIIRGPGIDGRFQSEMYQDPANRPEGYFLFSHQRQGAPSRLEVLTQQPRVWRKAEDVRPGFDFLPIYYGQNVWSNAEIWLDTDFEINSTAVPVELPSVLDEDVAWFLGMLAGDVTIKSNGDVASTRAVRVRLQAEDPGVADRARLVFKRLFGRDVEPQVRNPERPDRLTFELRSSRVMRWLARNFEITDNVNRRRVPEAILASPRHVVAAYLSGFYDSDGTYDDRTGRPSFTSGSSELIRVVSLLLLNLGAPCSTQEVTVSKVASEDDAGSRAAVRQGQTVWRVQGLQAPDGDWSWLDPSHTRRRPWVQCWQETFANRKGKNTSQGVIYAQVSGVEPVGPTRSYDMAVPEMSSFTCSGALVHNCPAWCGFCALSYRTKPYRQRSVGMLSEYATQVRDNMGTTGLTPFSPDLPMYTQRKKLFRSLLENVSDEVDAGAMRVDDFIADGDFILLQVKGGLDAVTLGLEGSSQRMRDLVSKGTSDADVKEAVARGIRAGIRKFKLFMISNLPGEDEGDVFRVLKLAKDLADIRDSLGQPNVRIQLSWTPLLIEAGTPFQWFAAPTPTRTLGDVWEELRDLKIAFKVGAKSQPDKAAFFQACQRASRQVGEALIDVVLATGKGCWGGVPKTVRADLEAALVARGFLNGFDDIFDERFQDDLFGWEHVEQGISTDLLWVTYLQMREFIEATDSHTYDLNFGDAYHGSEWIARCDTQCMGRACGACDAADLRKRKEYIVASRNDPDIDLAEVTPIDQSSVAVKVRVEVDKAERYRFVENDHWRFNLRRAFFRSVRDLRAQRPELALDPALTISKRSIRFASDVVRYRDWTWGRDYLEVGLTRPLTRTQCQALVEAVSERLVAVEGDEGSRWLALGEWMFYPAAAPNMRTDVDLSLWEVEVDQTIESASSTLAAFEAADYVPLSLKAVGGYFGPKAVEVNAKDHLSEAWLVRRGHRLLVRMLVRGEPSPYVVWAALSGKPSWIDTAARPARRIDAFIDLDPGQADFLRPACLGCGRTVPVDLMERSFDPEWCPGCRDEVEGLTVLGSRVGPGVPRGRQITSPSLVPGGSGPLAVGAS